MATRLSEVQDHAKQAESKLRDVLEVHLPAVAAFLGAVQTNPLVTSMQAVVDGDLNEHSLALLNALSGMAGQPAETAAKKKS